jgi:hypothetical protein
MRSLLRISGLIALLFSAIGIIGCVALIIGTWVLYQRVSEKVQSISARIDAGLERVSTANQNVRDAVTKARSDVADVRQGSVNIGAVAGKKRPAARVLHTLIERRAGPTIDNLGGRLATLSDAAAAASSLMDSAPELVPSGKHQIDADQLKNRADEVQQLSVILRRLDSAIDDGDKEIGQEDVEKAAVDVDAVLERCQSAVQDWQSDLDGLRHDIARIEQRIAVWLLCAAVLATVLFVWIGAGQVSLFGHAWHWCFG